MAATLTTLLTTATPVVWSNGDPFDGYLLLTLNYPAGRTRAGLSGYPEVTIPTYIKVPIIAGEITDKVRPWQNAELVPPGNASNNNMSYGITWYDVTGILLDAGGNFILDESPYTLTQPTLTRP